MGLGLGLEVGVVSVAHAEGVASVRHPRRRSDSSWILSATETCTPHCMARERKEMRNRKVASPERVMALRWESALKMKSAGVGGGMSPRTSPLGLL